MEFKKQKRRKFRSASGSTADIAFLLLIFFMVVTSLNKDQSISMVLPPAYNGPAGQVSETKVLSILINADNQIMLENKISSIAMPEQILADLSQHLTQMIALNIKPYVLLKMHPDSNYETYLQVLAIIKTGIKSVKSDFANKLFSKDLSKLNREEFVALSKKVKITISEQEIQNL